MKRKSQNGRWGIPSCNYFEDEQGGHRQCRSHSYSFEAKVLAKKRQHVTPGEPRESQTPPGGPGGRCCADFGTCSLVVKRGRWSLVAAGGKHGLGLVQWTAWGGHRR